MHDAHVQAHLSHTLVTHPQQPRAARRLGFAGGVGGAGGVGEGLSTEGPAGAKGVWDAVLEDAEELIDVRYRGREVLAPHAAAAAADEEGVWEAVLEDADRLLSASARGAHPAADKSGDKSSSRSSSSRRQQQRDALPAAAAKQRRARELRGERVC